MEGGTIQKILRAFVLLVGGIAVLAGGTAVLFGATSISGIEDPSPAVDSEMRFFAVWYALAGVAMVGAGRRPEPAGTLVRTVAVAFFVAGCARAISWATVGRPPSIALVLMVVELAMPFAVFPLQRSVERHSSRPPDRGSGGGPH